MNDAAVGRLCVDFPCFQPVIFAAISYNYPNDTGNEVDCITKRILDMSDANDNFDDDDNNWRRLFSHAVVSESSAENLRTNRDICLNDEASYPFCLSSFCASPRMHRSTRRGRNVHSHRSQWSVRSVAVLLFDQVIGFFLGFFQDKTELSFWRNRIKLE